MNNKANEASYRLLLIFIFILTLLVTFHATKVNADVDGEPPITTYTIIQEQHPNGIYYGLVEIQLDAHDSGSGVLRTEYRFSENSSWIDYSSPFTLTEQGVYHIRYRSVDHANNIESEKSVKLTLKADMYPPETKVYWIGELGDNGFYISDLRAELTATDLHSGISYTEYSLDQGQTWLRYSEPFLLEESIEYLYFRSVDNGGNIEKMKKEKIVRDLVKPSAPSILTDPLSWTNSTVTVTIIDGNDYESGSAGSQYKIGEDGEWTEYTQPFTVNEDDAISVYARTKDHAGNFSETTSRELLIDKIPPTEPNIYIDYEDWTDEEVFVKIYPGEDHQSSVKDIEYKVGDHGDWQIYYREFAVDQEGNVPIYARTVDWAGNVSDVVEGRVKIDRTPPSPPAHITLINKRQTSAMIRWTEGVDHASGVSEYEIYNGDDLILITQLSHQIIIDTFNR